MWGNIAFEKPIAGAGIQKRVGKVVRALEREVVDQLCRTDKGL